VPAERWFAPLPRFLSTRARSSTRTLAVIVSLGSSRRRNFGSRIGTARCADMQPGQQLGHRRSHRFGQWHLEI
jgi:hypothetical protein